MTEDPIRDSRNWYAYVANNPVNLIDPLGLCVSYTDTQRADKHDHNLYIYTDDDFGIPGWVLSLGEALKKGDFVFEFDKEKKEIIQVNPNTRIVEANSDIEFNQALVDYAKDIGNRIDLSVSSHATSEQIIMNHNPPKELWNEKINYVDRRDFVKLKEQGVEIIKAHFSGCGATGYVELPFINIVQEFSEIFQVVATGYTSGTASSLISAFEFKEGEYVRVSMKDGKFLYDPKVGYILQYLYADELIEYSNGKMLNRRTRGSRRWHEQQEE